MFIYTAAPPLPFMVRLCFSNSDCEMNVGHHFGSLKWTYWHVAIFFHSPVFLSSLSATEWCHRYRQTGRASPARSHSKSQTSLRPLPNPSLKQCSQFLATSTCWRAIRGVWNGRPALGVSWKRSVVLAIPCPQTIATEVPVSVTHIRQKNFAAFDSHLAWPGTNL